MPYEPLHHKYRPQSFGELVGQGAIAKTLSNALQQQRIAPAYLFTGPRGTGKTSSARILAKSLNCIASDVPTAKPCGTCDSCRSIARGSALDVIEIDAASNTGVDNIRELIERAQFAPVQCRFKVYVIDEVHMLSVAAFNALLKTLEEPPDRVVFVLATTDPQKVLPTIISRCQRFDFRRIPLDDMVQHLQMIAQAENIIIHGEAIHLVAQMSQGGLRDAESLLDQLSLLDGEITVDRVWDLVGAVPERDLLALVQAIAQDDAVEVIERARYLLDRGREPLIVLQNLASFYRDLLIAKTAGDRGDLTAITPGTWSELRQFVQTVDISIILQGQQHLRASELQVKNTTQPRLWLEVALMGLLPSAIIQQMMAPQAPAQRQEAASPSPSARPAAGAPQGRSPAPPALEQLAPAVPVTPPPAPAPTPAPTPTRASTPAPAPAAVPAVVHPVAQAKPEPDAAAPPAAAAADSSTNLPQIWQDVLSLVQPYSTQTLLRQQCHLIALQGNEARITVNSQPLFKIAKDRLPNVEVAFQQFFDRPIRVSLEVAASQDGSSPAPAGAPVANPSGNPSVPASAPTPSPYPAATAVTAPPAPSAFPAPVPAPVPPPAAAASRAESGASFGAASQPPDPATPAPAWQGDDELITAAKSLAQMFNGQIVDLDQPLDSGAGADQLAIAADALSEPDKREIDDDVPF